MPYLPGEVRRRTVTTALSLHRGWKDKWLNFVDVTFRKRVDLRGIQARGIGFYRCRFEEGADLSGVDIGTDLIAYRTMFQSAPRISDSPTGRAALRLDGARIGGDLRVLACTAEIVSADPNQIPGGVFAENLRVAGDVDFRGFRVHRTDGEPEPAELQSLEDRKQFTQSFGSGYPHLPMAFRLAGSQIEGNLRMGALQDENEKGIPVYPRFPRLSFFGGPVELANVRISGDVDLSGFVATKWLSLRSSSVGGSVLAPAFLTPAGRLVRFVVGDSFDLYGVQIAGSLDLSSAYLASGLSIVFGRIEGGLFARPIPGNGAPPLELGRDEEGENSLDLSGSRCGMVECDAVKMDGFIKATTGEFGRIFFSPSNPNPDPTNMEVSLCEAAGLVMHSVVIKENAVFRGIRLNGSISGQQLAEKESAGAFRMIACSVGRDLVVGSDGLCGGLWANTAASAKKKRASVKRAAPSMKGPFDDATSKPGRKENEEEALEAESNKWWEKDAEYRSRVERLDVSGTKVDRDLDLSCLEVGRDIVLDHATVGGDLRMSGKSYKYGAPRVVEHARFRTRCTKLDAQALHCEGDADLSGLVVAKGARGGGDVTARHMSVRGDLNLADLDDHRPLADIAGSVDLQGASASRLVLSGKNFSQERSGSLDLSDTEFQKITVRSANKLPATRTEMLKLHHSRVGRWEITSWDDGKMKEREEHNAIDFLKKTTPILGGAHHSLERHLREEGRFNEANEVLRETAMHAWNLSISDLFSSIGRDWREKKTFGSKLRYILNWRRVEWPVFKASWYWVFSVLSRFVGYGTNPWPSLIFILGLFLASTMVFYNAAHVDAAKTFRERMDLRTVQTAEIHPGDKVKCNAVCAGSDKCLQQCSSWSLERALLLTIGYSTPLGKLKEDDLWRPSLDAVYFASAMSLLNWILWPVFLATVTKYILRRL